MEGKMSDAISRSAVLKEIDWAIDLAMDDEMHHAMCTLGERFKELPALDVAPVVYAEWTEYGGTYTCSNCGGQYEKYDHMGYWNGEYKYCPNCGARMDGEAE